MSIELDYDIGNDVAYVDGERYVPESGTCQADETETIECLCDDLWHYGKPLTVHVMECSECGHTYEHVNGSYEFCPRCGRQIVEVEENDG